ncbi:restriction/modification enzyme [Streptomyces albus]|uniref:site-specific DNA-methyltransferase (adenine-specific) n=1 Tax=Streptomyces albus (strain ATCC 21838 / DSM 41398 / FERM P-419 / JCM 4703 / NBRC 107858) TaxID=1081613 RepID=A0A0B5ER49_STRA4|nr:restriction/modification enzyme [Streptomyces albus]AOU76061.1 restriction/modification enzyme [Streptomyces albus]
MLNITVAGTTLSTYYLSDPALFLHDQRDHIGADDAVDGVRHAKRELRRLVADIDETSATGDTRKRMLSWLSCFGWTFPGSLPAIEEPVLGRTHDSDHESAPGDLVSVLITPPGQHLDASPTGRRTGKLRPQRQAEVCAREHRLPAVLLSNGTELRVIRRDPGLGGEASYLSVDLAGLAELGDDHEWRILWALLRPEAFILDGSGEFLWKHVEDASSDAATAVSENLSGGVRTAISAIANGALHHWRQHDKSVPEPRPLFADALKIAYRLLFVAYAEDRGLLPIGTPSYDRGYSLRALRKDILTAEAAWEPDGGFLWSSLRAQWALLRDGIDAGELQITGFNGGLFDPAKCQLLDDPNLTVGDTFVRDVIDALSWTEAERSKGKASIGRRAVNYRELGVEQLGSIYEGLLSFEPQIADTPKVLARIGRGQSALVQVLDADRLPENAESIESYDTGSFYLFEASGQRKGSGSYYTARPLAHFVVGETLRPLVQDATPSEILNLRICDPAMGSGAFLVPAVHQLTEAYGEALARTGEALDPKLDDAERAAYRRLIVERCIYGVDLNPMAVELAKVSLWLTTAAAGKPLSFLDAHLRCGNAIIGASIDSWEGVPVPAQGGRVQRGIAAVDDLQESLFAAEEPDLSSLVRIRQALAHEPSEDRLDVRGKEKRFARLLGGDDFKRLRNMGDWWVAPFFYPEYLKSNSGQWLSGHNNLKNGDALRADLAELPSEVHSIIQPFHWEIEFPEVFFDSNGERRTDSGFDVLIGNPPWEGITFKSAEFYSRFDPSYTLLKKKDPKLARQAELDTRPEVAAAREEADRILAGVKSFIKGSGIYRMLYSHGTTFNYYRTFLERELAMLAPNGRIGLVIDSGVVSDAATVEHRRELLERCTIEHFVLCDNVEGLFPIHRSEQFLLLVAAKGGTTDPLPFTGDVSKLEHLMDLDRRTLEIPLSTIEALDPENFSIPDTRDPELLSLFNTIYKNRPLFLDPMPNGRWNIEWGRELHLDDDRKAFDVDGTGIPMRDGKDIHQYVHDFAEPIYHLREGIGDEVLVNRIRKRAKKKNIQGLQRLRGEANLNSPEVRRDVIEVPADHYRPCVRRKARAGDERTLIATILPPNTALTEMHFFYRSDFDHTANGYRTALRSRAMVFLVALLNSLILDFVVRRKVSSTVSKTLMASLPIADVDLDSGAGAEVVRLAGRLVCRASEFDELADVLGIKCEPLSKNEESRLRAELDARVAHLYGLTGSQLELVLADFRQSADTEGSPVRPGKEYKQLVREHFARLAG